MIDLLNTQDLTPWFSSQTSVLIGAIGGAGIGILGAAVGVSASLLVPKGKGRRAILGLMTSCVVLGILSLIAGVIALSFGQPYAVWYPLALLGLISTIVMGCLLPVMRRRYSEAEQRRLDAEDLRRS